MRILKFLPLVFSVFLAGGLAAAQAQSASPREIQAEITAGQNATALGQLQTVLQAHPHSGVAWYLSAEAQDASGNEDAARAALAKAEQYAPGLPFANQNDVAQLQAHLATQAAPARSGGSHIAIVLGVLVVLFVLFRLFARARRGVPAYQSGFAPGYADRPQSPYGPGGMPYGPAAAPGGGIGGALLGGLAAGAGIAAGERIIDDVMGGNRDEQGFGQGGGFDTSAVPDRDDGLQGSPGWDDSSSFDNGGSGSNDSW